MVDYVFILSRTKLSKSTSVWKSVRKTYISRCQTRQTSTHL